MHTRRPDAMASLVSAPVSRRAVGQIVTARDGASASTRS